MFWQVYECPQGAANIILLQNRNSAASPQSRKKAIIPSNVVHVRHNNSDIFSIFSNVGGYAVHSICDDQQLLYHVCHNM